MLVEYPEDMKPEDIEYSIRTDIFGEPKVDVGIAPVDVPEVGLQFQGRPITDTPITGIRKTVREGILEGLRDIEPLPEADVSPPLSLAEGAIDMPELDIKGSPISAMADLIPDLADMPPEIREAHPFKLVDTAANFWSQYLMTPEQERELQQKYPDAMAVRYAGLDLLLPGVMGKIVSPSELEEFTQKTPKEQKEEILGLAASYAAFGGAIKGPGKALVEGAIKRFPILAKDIIHFVPNWFRRLTNRERGVAIQELDMMVAGMEKEGATEGEILRAMQRLNTEEAYNRFAKSQKIEPQKEPIAGEGPVKTEEPKTAPITESEGEALQVPSEAEKSPESAPIELAEGKEAVPSELPEPVPEFTKDQLKDITVKIKALNEDTGAILEIDEDAYSALEYNDSKTETLYSFLECLE